MIHVVYPRGDEVGFVLAIFVEADDELDIDVKAGEVLDEVGGLGHELEWGVIQSIRQDFNGTPDRRVGVPSLLAAWLGRT